MKDNFSYNAEDEHIVDVEAENEKEKEPQEDYAPSKTADFLYDWVRAMLASICVVVLLLTFCFRLVTIDGDSMNNTLINADKVILTTFNYKPKNGDIVAISHGGSLNKTIIKRIIATEGQTISFDFDKAQVIVDGVIIDEPYIKDPTTQVSNWDIPSFIPEGYVFVMGDNRAISLDSRNSAVGLIPADDIIGKAQVVVVPFNHFKYLY